SRRAGDRDALRTRRGTGLCRAGVRLARTPCAADLFRGRGARRRSGRRAAGGAPHRDGGGLHGGGRRGAPRPHARAPPRRGGGGSYSTEARSEMLDVDAALIDAHGAVSEPVAEAMARGALSRFGADTAVATTGIAGPGGGTKDKPVGTVCFSVMLADGPTLT